MAKKFYAYLLIEKKIEGIVENWEECKRVTKGTKARYKSFSTKKEAADWLASGGNYENKKQEKKRVQASLPEAVYFDAGTGRGIGVEVRVTDVNGNSLLHHSKYSKWINQYGNIPLGSDRTNNYGELLGLYLAIEIAQKLEINHILGDSNLVLYFWSKGICKRETLPIKTIELIDKVITKRKEFEGSNGKIEYVSGDYNPADLGFHK